MKNSLKNAIINACIKNNEFVLAHLNRPRKMLNDHTFIDQYQTAIMEDLRLTQPDYDWDFEWQMIKTVKDAVDIVGKPRKTGGKIVIIELDAARSDQMCQKFVSRLGYVGLEQAMDYIPIIYPKSKSGRSACRKYAALIADIAKACRPSSDVVTLYVDAPNGKIEQW